MMQFIRNVVVALLSCILGLNACVTPPPEEVCSAEWVSKRTDKAMAEFGRDVRPLMRTFRKAGQSLERGNLGALQSIGLLDALGKMQKRMADSQALEDIKLLGESCNDPDLLFTSFSDFMRDQGIPDQIMNMMEQARELFGTSAATR